MHTPGAAAAAVLATLALASGGAARSTADPLVGQWEIDPPSGAIFEFVGSGGHFSDKVIKPRPGVLCPAQNDKAGQIQLTKSGPNTYTGTWEWFNGSDCSAAGPGKTTVTLTSPTSATLVSNAPPGLSGSETHSLVKEVPEWIQRAKEAKAALEQALRDELAAQPLIKASEYSKAVTDVRGSDFTIEGALLDLERSYEGIPAGTPAKQEASGATTDSRAAKGEDFTIEGVLLDLEKENGSKERAARELALTDLEKATAEKRKAIDALTSAIASGG